MEYRRINNNAVQCIITKEDMEGYGLTIVDIFERNEKGEKFLRDVVQEALEEVGGEMSGGNIAMQISPTQDKAGAYQIRIGKFRYGHGKGVGTDTTGRRTA